MRSRKGILCLVFLAAMVFLSGTAAFAQDGDFQAEGMSVFRMVVDHSGWPGFIIILLSIIAIFLAMRFVFMLRSSEMMPEELIAQVEDDVDNMRVGDAIKKCLMHESFLARILEDGFRELRAGYEEMVKAAEDSAESENIRLQQQIGWLSIIGSIAPMLGLMGTVLGMLGAFGVIAGAETQPPPRLLAEQIQLALVTTAEGLIVGVPVLVVYAALRNRATALFLDMGLIVSDLLDRFKHADITPAMIEEVTDAMKSARGPAPAQTSEAAAPAEEKVEDVEELEEM